MSSKENHHHLASDRPPLSDEENEQVMKFLTNMERMETEDPQQFAQIMAQLGLGGSPEEEGQEISSTNKVVEAISQLRSSQARRSLDANISGKEIKLPDGKTMAAGGIKSQQKGIEITPEPGFVVKTKRLNDNMKVFANICQHDALAEPALKKRLNAEGEEVEGMNIPISVGPRRLERDKSDAPCHVYDVIVNPTVIQDVIADITGKKRDFLCQLAIQGLEQKYKEELDKKYKLPKLRYLGEKVIPQYIQDRKSQPVIEEVTVPTPSSSGGSKRSSSVKSVSAPVQARPDEVLLYSVCWLCQGSDDGDGYSEEVIQVLLRDEEGSVPVYVEPLAVPGAGVSHILFSAHLDMAVSGASLENIIIKISAFKLSVCVQGYRAVFLPLPAAILPPSRANGTPQTYSVIRPVEGYTRLMELRIAMALDMSDWSAGPDPGSRAWLVAQALGGGSDDRGGEARKVAAGDNDKENSTSGGNSLPEDKFHIRLPGGVDKYTGQKLDYDENDPSSVASHDEVFAEDRFHKADVASQYIIDQREKDIKAKWDKHEKEKAERVNDPNVEYIELDDYKPGGKYGPEKDPTSKSFELSTAANKAELKKVSEILQSTVVDSKVFDWSLEPDIGDGSGSALKSNPIGGLSSTLWTELLD